MGLISEIICSDLVLERSEYHSDEDKEPGAEEEEEEKFRVLQEKCKILQERKLQEITEYLGALEELGKTDLILTLLSLTVFSSLKLALFLK